ncbi:MAG: hypothetical protein AMJ38_05050 [Dehalococcoidia bacterium DG_22]|jgi:hypothetical protein|nr:MAG: hypothetical protein AMJ38_05050 [Dehalococcoidia bacterium DG_22]
MKVPKHHGKDGGSEGGDETNNLTTHMLDWAKEKIAAGTTELPKKEQAAPKTERRQTGTLIVVAVRGDAPNQAQAQLFEDEADAKRFVETLMEHNVDQERIAILRGKALEMNVTYRPVIQLGLDGDPRGNDDQDREP